MCDLADWHDRPIAEIKRADIKELIRLKARTAPIAANRLVALISKIFDWALKEELIESSPAMQIDRPGKETERERRCRQRKSGPYGLPLTSSVIRSAHYSSCLLVTGQRRGEVAGMKWSEITADGWRLPGERAKKGKGPSGPAVSHWRGRFSTGFPR